VMVFEEGSDLEAIMGSLMTPMLLSEEQLVILENPPEDFTLDLSIVTNNLALIIWFDRELLDKKPIMQWVKNLKGDVLFFPEGKEISIFPFLDHLVNKDKRAYLEMEKLKNANFDVAYFITMIFYLLRSLVFTPKSAPAFVRDKLKRQRIGFSLNDLIKLYKNLLIIDFKIKSGVLEKPQAEFLLINKFLNPPSVITE